MRFLCTLSLLIIASTAMAEDVVGSATVIDGDTLLIDQTPIELWGVDAPELKQTCRLKGIDWPCGLKAMEHLAMFVAGKIAVCVEKTPGQHSHPLFKCSIGSLDMGAEMVEVGLALPYVPISDTYYIRSYKEARGLGQGIHAGQHEKPWLWRLTNTEANSKHK